MPRLMPIRMLAVLLSAAMLAAMPPPGLAQDAAAKKQRKATGTLSESAYRQLERIHELIAKDRNAEAMERLGAMMERSGNDYEKAIVYQTAAFVHVSQNNYKAAIKAFETAVQLDALPQQPYEQMMFNLAQLYFQDNQTEKAATLLERYFAEATIAPPADAHILLASVYADRKRYRDALPQVDQAIAKAREPKESWLQLKLALHYELKQFPQCAEVLVQLVQLAPQKEDYWKQLSSVFFEIKRDRESLAVLALAERQGYLDTEGEIRNLANVYLLLEIPYKAAAILQQGLDRKVLKADEKTLSLLGDAWTMAREYDKAEPVLKQAASVADKGDIYFRLGQIYIEDERWKPALEMLEKAQAKGGLKKPGEAALLEGVAAFNAGNRARAVDALLRAMNHDDSRNNAAQWLSHVRSLEAQEGRNAPPAAVAPQG
jgi:tetratricopeptide (TPR) repeat protein